MANKGYRYGSSGINTSRSPAEQSLYESDAYRASIINTNVSDGTTESMLVQTGDRAVRVGVDVGSDGGIEYRLFEGGTVGTAGTTLDLENGNRVTQPSTDIAAESNPSMTDKGSEILENYSAGSAGNAGGVGKTPGAVSPRAGWILQPNNNYLFEVTNVSGSASVISLNVSLTEIHYSF